MERRPGRPVTDAQARAARGRRQGGADAGAAASPGVNSAPGPSVRTGPRPPGCIKTCNIGMGTQRDEGGAARPTPQEGARLAVCTCTVRLLMGFLLLAVSVPPTANANTNMQQHGMAHAPGARSTPPRELLSPPAAPRLPPPYSPQAPTPAFAFGAEEVALLVDLDARQYGAPGTNSQLVPLIDFAQ